MDDHEDRYQVAGMSDPPATPPTDTTPAPNDSLPLALVAGLVAAIAGGVVWALIVKATDYELGFVAWGIGFLVGTAIALATRGAKGRRLQITAVVFALLGILLGKYLSYALILQEEAETFGQSIGLFSSDMFEFFRDDLDNVFGLFDLLWAGFAVFSAWRLLQPEEPQLAEGPPRTTE